MPRVLRKSKRRTRGLDEWHVCQLETGHEFLTGTGFATEAELRDGWELLRDRILGDWITRAPGTRPFAWWKFDAPEPRRCLNGVRPAGEPTYFGLPATFVPATDQGLIFETEWEYLDRLGLLTTEERKDSPCPG